MENISLVRLVQERIGYTFKNEALLAEALTHPSAVKEGRSRGPDNQRLEYLGDAVLQLAVSHMLVIRFPESGEGDLSFLRAEMVRRENLAEVAAASGIPELVLMGPSLESAPTVAHDTVAADALEALLGAVYLDGGWDNTVQLVEELFTRIPEPGGMLKGAKSSLQEIIQGRFGGEVPEYEVAEDTNGCSDSRFTARVFHRGRFLGEGIGRSKKRAEEAAAMKALAGFEEEP
ncbi:MAG: ribonuclease III [bacterium]|nr:ribonuclease III [bacterium]MDT8396847.1 ribonuclease III [bacterium]